jgi:hypothetical protein
VLLRFTLAPHHDPTLKKNRSIGTFYLSVDASSPRAATPLRREQRDELPSM